MNNTSTKDYYTFNTSVTDCIILILNVTLVNFEFTINIRVKFLINKLLTHK